MSTRRNALRPYGSADALGARMAIIDKDTQKPASHTTIILPETFASQAHPLPKKQSHLSRLWTVPLTAVALLLILITPQNPYDHAFVATKLSDLNVVLRTGPFVHHSLAPTQVNALMHMIIHVTYKQLAQEYVAHMTLDEELGQLIMAEYYTPTYSDDLETMITKLHAGGVVMYALQMHTFEQTKNDIAQMQKHAQLPLLISTDEEGGFVERVQNIYGDRPGALQTYQTGNINNAAKLGHSIAHDLLALGINEDLAPDVDVQLVDGPDQYLRTWGYTAQSVIQWAGVYMRAVQGDGMIACIKHFPGLGDASTDAHYALPVVKRTRDQLYAVELAPFKAFIQSSNKVDNPGMVMPTDVLMPAIDPTLPAELSPTFINGILRKEFGYDGVVITDGLYMQGITNKWTVPQAAVMALNAGDDMILGPNGSYQMMQVIDALKAALQNGTLAKSRVDEAATRIITLKLERHLMLMEPPSYYGFNA